MVRVLKGKEVKNRLDVANACFHLVQNILSSHMSSKYIKIKMHRTLILSAVLYGCET
jgi:predicted thioredoxin/glutaredoxin